jgi:hypothetical protein
MPDKRKTKTIAVAKPPATIIHRDPAKHDTGFHSGTFRDRGFHSDAFKGRDRGR